MNETFLCQPKSTLKAKIFLKGLRHIKDRQALELKELEATKATVASQAKEDTDRVSDKKGQKKGSKKRRADRASKRGRS